MVKDVTDPKSCPAGVADYTQALSSATSTACAKPPLLTVSVNVPVWELQQLRRLCPAIVASSKAPTRTGESPDDNSNLP